jgi:hypothetical protein
MALDFFVINEITLKTVEVSFFSDQNSYDRILLTLLKKECLVTKILIMKTFYLASLNIVT